MIDKSVIDWLLEGDISVQYQVYLDLLNENRPDLRERISKEGWGAKFLSCRNKNNHWGLGFYQPKWTSSHYTLLDLKNLGITQNQEECRETIFKILKENSAKDGGVNPSRLIKESDVCLNGMFLNYATYFRTDEIKLVPVVDFILSQQLPDGGFNCNFNRKGAAHSSLHSSLSVIEGIREYFFQGYNYRLNELLTAEKQCQEFILIHKLFRSHRTGEVIDRKMLMLSYPSRWRYDILRALDYFRHAGTGFDLRMTDALDLLIGKQRNDDKWPLQAKHSGAAHFEMEKCGEPSRWNTLRAMRVLRHFKVCN
jgi:hypothetical protein